MSILRLLSLKNLFLLVPVLVIIGGIYAFAAANTVPDSTDGVGSGNITGVVVSDIDYTVQTTAPYTVTQVSFTATYPGPGIPTIQVELVQDSDSWYSCTGAGTASTWTCNTASPTVLTANTDLLTVLAFD